MSSSRSTLEAIVLALNAIWCGCAFVYFSLLKSATLSMIIPKARREEKQIGEYAFAATRFLGGINLAVSFLAVGLLLVEDHLFDHVDERIVLHAFFAAVHLSQFLGNLPVLAARRQDPTALWPVLSGRMFRVFVTDAVMTIANVYVVGSLQGSK